jgi:predicted phage tail protein
MHSISHTKLDSYRDTVGAGGGKSGGGGGAEAPDTLVTNETIKILNLLGEGETNLFTGDGRSIFLNNIPLENSDGSFNFGNYNETLVANNTLLYFGAGSTYWEYRNGSLSQTPMTNPAFPSATTIFNVNQEFTGGTSSPPVAPAPVIYSVTSPLVDYAKVAIKFPNGLANVDSHGNIVGDEVEFTIDVKPHASGGWMQVLDHTTHAKSDNAAVVQYQVNNPNPGSLWDIRVSRVTPDNSSATRRNQTFVDSIEEVQQITLPYNGIAYCGLALDAATIGGSNTNIPQMSFLVQKGPITIPSNFDPNTHVFTGVWDGTFTTGVTDDPVWCLYDMITNPQYGLVIYGRITTAMVDKFSFYNASVFNNALVSDGKGGIEPRFTFNTAIQNRQDVYITLNQVAAVFNSVLSWDSGLLKVLQDRPTASMYAITKSNAIGSDPVKPIYFTYTGTSQPTRNTVVNVTWTDGSDPQFLPTTVSVKDDAGLSRYGYNPYDLAAFGATTEGQALRAGKYYLFQQLNNTEQVEWTTGVEGFKYALYDVFDLFDDDYAATAVGGRVVSATASTITFDQPITITGTSSKVSVWLQDGVTYETHNITNSAGIYSTVSIAGSWSTIPTQYTTYGVTSAVAPRQFRIVNLKYDSVAKTVDTIAVLYNEGNYAYVETGVAVQAGVYSIPQQVQPSPPTNVAANATQYISPIDSTLVHGVSLSWDRPASQNVGYVVKWRKDNGAYTTSPQFAINSFQLSPLVQGVYDFVVFSINIAGNYSTPATVSYTLDTSGGGAAALAEVTSLEVVGGGTAWTSEDLSIQWTNPVANQGVLKDFLVTFKTTGGLLLREVVVDNVNGGEQQTTVYHWADNLADGGPNRAIAVTVQCRDAYNDLTVGTTVTMTNAAPPVPSNITATPGLQSAIVSWTPETGTDIAGYMVWYSATTGFTPGPSNVIDCGNTALASLVGLIKSTNYFYRVAAYDIFGKSTSGTVMNLSSQLSFTTPSTVGVPSGSTLPTSGMLAGDTFFLTTTSTLYRFSGTVWIASGILSGAALPTIPSVGYVTGDVFYLTTDQKLYRNNGTSWVKAVDGADITANSIVANSIVTGTLTTALFTANTIDGSIVTAGTLTAAKITAGSISSTQIQAGGIVAASLSVATLSSITANIGTLTAGILTNNSGTNIIDLGATGSSLFINTPNFKVTAAGAASVTSLASLSANLGTVTAGVVQNSSGSAKFDLTNGQIVFNNGAFMKVTGTGFGSSNQFIEWYGPTQSVLTTCTETNAIFYLKTSGAAYFGGTLLAGMLTNTTQSTILNNTNVADLGPYSSNGGSITITYSFSFSGVTNFLGTSAGLTSYNAVTKQSPNFTIVLSRSISGGAFSDVATLSGTGGHSENAPDTTSGDPGFYRQGMSGSGTFTDTAAITGTREYKLRLTTWNNVNSVVVANTLAIQSVE